MISTPSRPAARPRLLPAGAPTSPSAPLSPILALWSLLATPSGSHSRPVESRLSIPPASAPSRLPLSPISHLLSPARSALSHLLAAIFCAVLCATAHATSVTLQGGFGYPNAKDSSGTPLTPGHKVSVGTFDPGADIAPDAASLATWLEENKTNLPALLAAWRQFHFTTTATIDGDPGSFWIKHSSPTGNVTVTLPDGSSSEFSFPGKTLYLLLTRTSTPDSEPAADGSNVLDFAIFTGPSATWRFRQPPSDSNLPPGDLASLNTSQITTAIAGTADPATGTFLLASYSSPENPADPGETPTAFDQWLTATFGENSTITADSSVGHSGLSALATYALASTPEATIPPYTTVTDENGRIGIEFTRKIDPALHTRAQASADLSDWTLPVTEDPVSSTTDTETVRAFPNFPEGADTTKAFFRIRVEPANQN